VHEGPPLRIADHRAAVVLSLLLFFAFVGVESSTGQWTVAFFEDARHLDHRWAGYAVSGFWAGITIGRLSLGRVAMTAGRLVAVSSFAALAIASAVVVPTFLAIPLMVLVGLCIAPQFPSVMAGTADRVGVALTPRMTGWQLLAANAGASSLPVVISLLVGTTDFAPVFVLAPVAAACAALHLVVLRRTATA